MITEKTTPNPPKDPKALAAAKKPQLQLLPPVFNASVANVLSLGASKYGLWNWRSTGVALTVYIGAMKRHIDAVLDGEDLDPESGIHHLAHVAATCAVVLDALKHETLIDDRPNDENKISIPRNLEKQ